MPTKKEQKQAKRIAKEVKRAASIRTRDERMSEVAKLRVKLKIFGFPDDAPGMIEIEALFSQYIEIGKTVCEKVSLREWDRVAEITLPESRQHDTLIVLRYVGTKKAREVGDVSNVLAETDAALVASAEAQCKELAAGDSST